MVDVTKRPLLKVKMNGDDFAIENYDRLVCEEVPFAEGLFEIYSCNIGPEAKNKGLRVKAGFSFVKDFRLYR